MTFIVQVQPGNLHFFVESGETVLDAALRQGFDFSYGCQHGVCGTCAAKLLQGKITYSDIEPLGLEDDEAAANFILLCSAIPESDLLIYHAGVTAPWQLTPKKLSYRVTEIKSLSSTVMQLLLEPAAEALRFQAGQYIELYSPTGEHRPFSIANAPLDGKQIEVHVHHSPDNQFSINLLQAAHEQKLLSIEGPFGRCIARSGLTYPLIFIAGGTGFSHSKALIEQMILQAPATPIHLFWGAKTPADLYMDTLPRHWQETLPAFQYTPTISRPDGSFEWHGHTTSLPKLITELYPHLGGHLIYASGPPSLVLDTWSEVKNHGLKLTFFNSDLMDFRELTP